MKKINVKTREIPKIEYYVNCPLCGNELKATSATQMDYNIRLHLEKHEKDSNKKNGGKK